MNTIVQKNTLRKPLCALAAFVAAAAWFYSNVGNWGIPAAAIFSAVIAVGAGGVLIALTNSVSLQNMRAQTWSTWFTSSFNRWDFILPMLAVGLCFGSLLSKYLNQINYVNTPVVLGVVAAFLVVIGLSDKKISKFTLYAAIYCVLAAIWMWVSPMLLQFGTPGILLMLFLPSWALMLISFITLAWNGNFARAIASIGLNLMAVALFQFPVLAILFLFFS